MDAQNYESEREWRLKKLAELRAFDPTLKAVPAQLLNQLDVFRGGRGTYAPYVGPQDGRLRVVRCVLHTGRHYDDELSDESLVYRFPSTKIKGYDQSDIEAGKAALALGMPLFISISPPKKSPFREVRVGYIVDLDSDSRQFLVRFSKDSLPGSQGLDWQNDESFEVTINEVKKKRRMSVARANDQARFAFNVMKRYGAKCAFCKMSITSMIDAAHIVAVADKGSDDPRNGIPLCKNHHAAFDAGLIGIENDGKTLRIEDGFSFEGLGLAHGQISTAKGAFPHVAAIKWRNELNCKDQPPFVDKGSS